MIDPIGGIGYVWPYILAFLGGYLFGSFPSGLILTRLAGLGDIRKVGSGNIGMTNVLRTGRKDIAAATLVIDLLKGVIAVWLGWGYGQDIAVLAGLGAVVGHCFPIWLGFRGGKAVATSAGVLLMYSWPLAIGTALVWIIVAFATRISSAGAVGACVAAPLIAWALAYVPIGGTYYGDIQRVEATAVIALIVLVRHHANIRRLIAGTEPRFGGSAAPKSD